MSRSITNRFSTIASDPLRSFRFYATFSNAEDGAAFDSRITTGFVGGFTQIGGLQMNIQDIPYREGGYNTTVHHIPGQTTFTPVVFQRGVLYGNDQAMTWFKGLFSVAGGTGLSPIGVGSTYRVNVNIYVADHPNTTNNVPKIGFKLNNAWITNLNYSDLNAGPNEILFETMTLVHEGLEVFFTNPTTSAPVAVVPGSKDTTGGIGAVTGGNGGGGIGGPVAV